MSFSPSEYKAYKGGKGGGGEGSWEPQDHHGQFARKQKNTKIVAILD